MIARFVVAIALVGCSSRHEPPAATTSTSTVPTPTPPPSPDAGAAMTNDLSQAVGTWRIPPGQRSRSEPGTVEMPGTTRFAFDGTTVTLYLLTEKEWMWKSADDHYRLKTQWVGTELQYLPPFGRWTKLGVFRDGRFESDGVKAPWIYERVTDAMKDADDRILDQPRELHDYTIKPMDPR